MFGAMTGLTLGTGTAGWTWRGRVMRAVIDGSRTVAGAQQPGVCGGSGGSGGIAGKGPQGLPHGSKWVCDLAEQKLQPSQRPPNDARACSRRPPKVRQRQRRRRPKSAGRQRRDSRAGRCGIYSSALGGGLMAFCRRPGPRNTRRLSCDAQPYIS